MICSDTRASSADENKLNPNFTSIATPSSDLPPVTLVAANPAGRKDWWNTNPELSQSDGGKAAGGRSSSTDSEGVLSVSEAEALPSNVVPTLGILSSEIEVSVLYYFS